MRIIQLKPGAEQALDNFLSHSYSTLFIRSNLKTAGLEFNHKKFEGEYFALFQDNCIKGVIAHYWNNNVMMQGDAETICPLIQFFLKQLSRPIQGLIGDPKLSNLFIENSNLTLNNASISSHEELFALSLNELTPPKTQINRCIKDAHQVSYQILFDWIKAYEMEALKSKNTPQLDKKVQEDVHYSQQNSNRFVLFDSDEPVCFAGINAKVDHLVQIGPVYTPPHQRNKGYARDLVGKILSEVQTQGIKKAILFTNNPYASKSYRSLGFKPIGHFSIRLWPEAIQAKLKVESEFSVL